MREREGAGWKGVKDKEMEEMEEMGEKRKGAVLEREFVFVVLTNPITHSFNQS